MKPGLGKDSCKSDCISEIRFKMFCDEDTKVVSSLINLTLTIYNHSGTFVQWVSCLQNSTTPSSFSDYSQSFLPTLLWTLFKIIGIYYSKVYHKILHQPASLKAMIFYDLSKYPRVAESHYCGPSESKGTESSSGLKPDEMELAHTQW